jgi:hypothetical protein
MFGHSSYCYGVKICKTRVQPLLRRPVESGLVAFFLKMLENKSSETPLSLPVLSTITPLFCSETKELTGWDRHSWERSILSNGIIVDTLLENETIIIIMHQGEYNLNKIQDNITTEEPNTIWKAKTSGQDIKISLFKQ